MTLLLWLWNDPCGFPCAALVMYVIGRKATDGREPLRRFGAALGGAALVLTFWVGVANKRDVLGLCVKAIALGAFTVGTTWIALALLAFAGETVIVAPARAWTARRKAAANQARLDREAWAAAQRAETERQMASANRLAPPPPPPPPPTVGERLEQLNAAFALALAGVEARVELTPEEKGVLRLQLMDDHAKKVRELTGRV